MLRCVGRGSYGEVWLARNALGTLRAVKVVYRKTFQDARPYEREFEGVQKYEPISRSNEGLLDILQIGRNNARGYFYYIMELADNAAAEPLGPGTRERSGEKLIAAQTATVVSYSPRTLASEIQARGRLPVEDCISLGLTLTLALGQLHRHGLIHRDVKPSNIIFIGGVPKLADIGLVTDFDATLSYGGTEGFIPPEGATSPQADIYALGKVLYEASTGKDRQDFPEPFTSLGLDAESRAIMELNAVLLRACDDAKKRYRSAEEMNADLALLNSGKSVRQKNAVEKRLKTATRIAVAAVAIIVLGVIPYFLVIQEARHAHKEAARAAKAELTATKREAEAQQKLGESYLAQAQAGRFSHRAGRRFTGLELLKKAAQIAPSPELRNEAIACLALPDLRLNREWPIPARHKFPIAWDRSFEKYALGDADGNIRVRQTSNDLELHSIRGFGYNLSSIRFSESGRMLAASYLTTNEPPLKIWNLESDDLACVPDIKWNRALAFSRNDALLGAVNPNESILIYDLKTGRLVKKIPYTPLAAEIAFDPEARFLAVCTEDNGKVELFELATGAIIRVFDNDAEVLGLAWNPSGTVLASACIDGRVYLWEPASGQRRGVLARHEGAAVGIQFSHSGDLLASTGWDQHLRLWDVQTGSEICSESVSDYFSPFRSDDRALFCAVSYERIGCFEIAPGSECRHWVVEDKFGQPTACAFSPDGQFLVTAQPEGLLVWQVKTGRQLAFQPAGEEIRSLGFNSARGTLITAGAKAVKEWTFQMATNSSSSDLQIGTGIELGPSGGYHFEDVGGGDQILVNVNRQLRLIELSTRQYQRNLYPGMRSRFAALSPQGNWCAVANPPTNIVSVCNLRTGKRLLTVPACRSTGHLAFSPDARWLALAGADEYRFFETANWQLVSSVSRKATGDLAGLIAFSPDSRIAAITYSQQVLRLVDPATGREIATLEPAEPRDIFAVAFSPDASLLAVLTWGRVVQIWDLRLIRSELASMNLAWDLPVRSTAAPVEPRLSQTSALKPVEQ